MRRELPEGCRARFTHFRYANENYGSRKLTTMDDVRGRELALVPSGGVTVARVLNDDGACLARGHAYCRDDEGYVKKIGRDIALGRALKALETMTKEDVP